MRPPSFDDLKDFTDKASLRRDIASWSGFRDCLVICDLPSSSIVEISFTAMLGFDLLTLCLVILTPMMGDHGESLMSFSVGVLGYLSGDKLAPFSNCCRFCFDAWCL